MNARQLLIENAFKPRVASEQWREYLALAYKLASDKGLKPLYSHKQAVKGGTL